MGKLLRLAVYSMAGTVASVGAARADTASGDSDSLQEVVVTAQRREQEIMKVPISVSAISAATLQDINATSFQDYAGTVPGLSYTYIGPLGYYGTRNYALRGITGTNTVGFYIDEAPLPILDPKLIDVSRIEVLRGPQATLYGSGSEGGTIKIVTAQPDSHAFSGHVDGSVSSTSGSERANSLLDGVVNVPIIEDVLAARISLSHIENAGYINTYFDPYPTLTDNSVPPYGRDKHGIDRGSNSEVAETARVAVRFTPTEHLTISPSILYNSDSIDSNDQFSPALPGLSIQHFFLTPESERYTLLNLTAAYDFDALQILSSTTHFRRTYTGSQDTTQLFPIDGYQTPTPVRFTTTSGDDIFTEEVHAQTHLDGPLNGLLGVIYDRNAATGSQSGPVPGLSAYNPTLPAVPGDTFFLGNFPTTTVEKDIYAEIRYKILPRLELTAGGRYYKIDINSSLTSSGLFGGGDFTNARDSEHGIRPRATVSWQATDDILVFSNYGKGFRPGGTNGPLPSICTNSGQYQGGTSGAFSSDTVTSYDLGTKLETFEHRADFSLAVYRMKWTDIQQLVVLPCGVGVEANTGDATSKGVEFESHARPIPDLTLDFEATWAFTRLDTAQPAEYAEVGDPILNIPRWKAGIGAEYEVALPRKWKEFTRLDFDYQSSEVLNYGDRPVAPPLVSAGYGTLGAHVGVKEAQWRIELYGSNLSNRHPITYSYTFATAENLPIYSTIQPRTLGLKATYTF